MLHPILDSIRCSARRPLLTAAPSGTGTGGMCTSGGVTRGRQQQHSALSRPILPTCSPGRPAACRQSAPPPQPRPASTPRAAGARRQPPPRAPAGRRRGRAAERGRRWGNGAHCRGARERGCIQGTRASPSAAGMPACSKLPAAQVHALAISPIPPHKPTSWQGAQAKQSLRSTTNTSAAEAPALARAVSSRTCRCARSDTASGNMAMRPDPYGGRSPGKSQGGIGGKQHSGSRPAPSKAAAGIAPLRWLWCPQAAQHTAHVKLSSSHLRGPLPACTP